MYTIIIAEDDTKNASGLEMPSWRDVQSYSVWPPFQAIEPYYPFKNSSIEDFIIGAENCESRQSGYCNGPLKSGTTYRVKVRAFTALDKFTDTAYSFPIQTGKSRFTGIAFAFSWLLNLAHVGKTYSAVENSTEFKYLSPSIYLICTGHAPILT